MNYSTWMFWKVKIKLQSQKLLKNMLNNGFNFRFLFSAYSLNSGFFGTGGQIILVILLRVQNGNLWNLFKQSTSSYLYKIWAQSQVHVNEEALSRDSFLLTLRIYCVAGVQVSSKAQTQHSWHPRPDTPTPPHKKPVATVTEHIAALFQSWF